MNLGKLVINCWFARMLRREYLVKGYTVKLSVRMFSRRKRVNIPGVLVATIWMLVVMK